MGRGEEGIAAAPLPTVSVLLPTFRYAAKIERTVRAVLDDPAATELVVVVDGERDGTLEVLESLREEDARVVPLFVEHVGKSGALAAGLEVARGEVTLLLDQDVVAGPGLVAGHAAHHRDAGDLLVVGYMPTVPDGAGGDVSLLTRLYAEEYEVTCRRYEADPRDVLLELWGGNVSIRTAACRRVGVDFRYFGHEDQDFGIRCFKAGLNGVFDRSLRAEHIHSRNAAAFLWYSKMQGASRWHLHTSHPDVLGPFDPDAVLDGMPAAARLLARAVATTALGERTAAGAARVGELAARARWPAAQAVAYRFARRVALRTGVTLAMKGREAELAARPSDPRRLSRARRAALASVPGPVHATVE